METCRWRRWVSEWSMTHMKTINIQVWSWTWGVIHFIMRSLISKIQFHHKRVHIIFELFVCLPNTVINESEEISFHLSGPAKMFLNLFYLSMNMKMLTIAALKNLILDGDFKLYGRTSKPSIGSADYGEGNEWFYAKVTVCNAVTHVPINGLKIQ